MLATLEIHRSPILTLLSPPSSCKRLPKDLIDDKNVAILYFKEFGRIRELTLHPGNACLVEYETPEEARKALHDSGFYKGQTFIVQSGTAFERQKRLSSDPSVLAELDIMSGAAAGATRNQPPRQQPQQAHVKAPAPTRPQLSLFQPSMMKKATPASEAMPPPPAPPKSPVMIHKMTVPELQRLIATPAFSSEQK